MRTHLFVVLLAIAAAIPVQAAPKDSTAEFEKLLASVKSGDTNIDYSRLRISYMDSADRKNAKDTSDAEKAMWQKLNAKDFAGAVKEADKVLASEYVNIDAHYVADVAHRELGETEKSRFHQAVFGGLIHSIEASGDGKSFATAWTVVTVHEEYVMLHALGLQPSQQSLNSHDHHAYDVLVVKDPKNGSDQTLYFNIDIVMAHEGF